MSIIAAFAGTGKTTFCARNKNAIDFECMPFKYENFIEVSRRFPGESIKAHDDLILKDEWQMMFYEALLDTYETYPDEKIVIPTIRNILARLEMEQIPYTLVYPAREAKEEYRKRYIGRGDSENFLKIFVDGWDYWMREVRSHENPNYIELGPEKYLSDAITIPEYDENKIIKDKDDYIFRRYFKNQAML